MKSSSARARSRGFENKKSVMRGTQAAYGPKADGSGSPQCSGPSISLSRRTHRQNMRSALYPQVLRHHAVHAFFRSSHFADPAIHGEAGERVGIEPWQALCFLQPDTPRFAQLDAAESAAYLPGP